MAFPLKSIPQCAAAEYRHHQWVWRPLAGQKQTQVCILTVGCEGLKLRNKLSICTVGWINYLQGFGRNERHISEVSYCVIYLGTLLKWHNAVMGTRPLKSGFRRKWPREGSWCGIKGLLLVVLDAVSELLPWLWCWPWFCKQRRGTDSVTFVHLLMNQWFF